VAKTITAEKRRRNMACDCAGQSYSYNSTAVNQCIPPAFPILYHIAIVPRSPFLVLLPTLSSFLLNPTFFSAQAPFFLCLSPKDESAVVAS
jgi:hypothetical protein